MFEKRLRLRRYRIALLLAVFMLAGTLAGCAQSASSKMNEITLQEVMEKNTLEALTAEFGGFKATGTQYSMEGEEFYSYTSEVQTTDDGNVIAVSDSEGYAEYIKDNIGYIRRGDGTKSVCYYMDEGEADSKVLAAAYTEGERLVSCEEKDGMYLLVSEIDWADIAESEKESYKEDYGITDGTLIFEYLVEPEMLFIESANIYYNGGDGQKTLLSTNTTEKSDSTEIPDAVAALMNAADTRTVTLVFRPNTESEESMSFTFAKDVAFGLITERSLTVYTDRECTVIHDGGENQELVDKTLYVVFDDEK